MENGKWKGVSWGALVQLTQGDFAGAALLSLEGASHFQEAVEHFRTFGTARRELCVGLLVNVFQTMKLIRNVQGGKNSNF